MSQLLARFAMLWRSIRGLGRPSGKGWLAAGLVLTLAAVGLWLLMRALPEGEDATWERIQQTGVLPVCTDPSWPPFEYIVEGTGQIEGLDVELARLLARRLGPGIRARMVTVGFDSLYDALLAGRCDAILSALPYEPMRVEDVAYSGAYFNAGPVLVSREGMPDIESVEDLADRVVGVEWGFVPEGDGRQRLFLHDLGLRRYETANGALRALQAGELDAAIADRITVLAYLRDCEGLRVVGEPLADINYVVALRQDSFRLLAEIDRALLEMRDDGTLDVLQDRWF
jgi:polar amino acid transport system substrate-binding protein